MGCLAVVCFIVVCVDGPQYADRQPLHRPLLPCCGLWFDEASCSPIASSQGAANTRADEDVNTLGTGSLVADEDVNVPGR